MEKSLVHLGFSLEKLFLVSICRGVETQYAWKADALPLGDSRVRARFYHNQYFTKVQVTVVLSPALTQCNCVKNSFS